MSVEVYLITCGSIIACGFLLDLLVKIRERARMTQGDYLHLGLLITTKTTENVVIALRRAADSIESGRYSLDDKGGTKTPQYEITWNLLRCRTGQVCCKTPGRKDDD